MSRGTKTGLCLEVHDLASSKILAFRPQDRDFVRSLLVHKMINSRILQNRVESTLATDELKQTVMDWIRATSEDM